MRKQKRFFRAIGVQFESEREERKEQQLVLGDYLVGKVVKMVEKHDKSPDSVGGFIKRDILMVHVYVKD